MDSGRRARSWRNAVIDPSVRPPSALTTTSIPQHHGLQQVAHDPPVLEDGLTSTDWISRHGRVACSLKMNDIIQECGPRRPPFGTHRNASSVFQDVAELPNSALQSRAQPVAVSIDPVAAQRIEQRLSRCIHRFEDRLAWLKSGSRKFFGHVPGSRVAVLLDCSANVHTGCGEAMYRTILKALIHDQFRHKEHLFPISMALSTGLVWAKPSVMNDSSLVDLLGWSQSFAFSGVCNLIGALDKLSPYLDSGVDCVMIVLASQPSQRASLTVNYVRQLLAGRDVKLHLVAINADDTVKACFHEIASRTATGFHFFCSSGSEGEEIFSSDIMELQQELEALYSTMFRLQQLKKGRVDLVMAGQLHKVKSFTAWPFKMQAGEADDLDPRKKVHCKQQPFVSSAGWLVENSLKCHNLDIYQLLAPNSIASCRQFVSVLNKDVAAQVHVERMTQFTWSDGSIRHVHADIAQLHDYQCRLGNMLEVYEDRVSWLKSDTRRQFGTVTGDEVVYLVDTSEFTAPVLTQLQEHLCHLLGEQIANCKSFNIGSFNSQNVQMFREKPVTTSAQNLEAAWRWVLSWRCEGSCDLLGGVRYALEGDGQVAVETFPFDSLTLVVTGCPSQAEGIVRSYLSQLLLIDHVKISVVLYTQGVCDGDVLNRTSELASRNFLDTSTLAGYLTRLSRQCLGHFHWFDSSGFVTSDDLQLIQQEMKTAQTHSAKAALLLEHMEQNAERYREEALHKRPPPSPILQPAPATRHITGPPRETLSSLTRKHISNQAKESSPKMVKKKPRLKHPVLARKPSPELQKSSFFLTQKPFYLDDGSAGVSVSSPLASRTSSRPSSAVGKTTKLGKGFGAGVSTQKWLKKNSVHAHGLNLAQMVVDRDYGNQHSEDSLLKKPFIRSRFCVLYPHVSISGSTYHMQLSTEELDACHDSLESLLRCYSERFSYLLSGSKRVFGPIFDNKVCITVDCSGSVTSRLSDLKSALQQLVTDQLSASRKSCCLVAFNSEVQTLQSGLVPFIPEQEEDWLRWIQQLECCGSTNTLSALDFAFSLDSIQSVYLVSDGLPDHGGEIVLQKCRESWQKKKIPIHAVSFPTATKAADEFLRSLAKLTGGSFHKAVPEAAAQVALAAIFSKTGGQSPLTATRSVSPGSDPNPAPGNETIDGLAAVDSFEVDGLAASPTELDEEFAEEDHAVPGQPAFRADSTLPRQRLRTALKDLRGDHLRALCAELLTAFKNRSLAIKYRKLSAAS